MKSWQKTILRLALLGTLYVLASPVYLVLGALRLHSFIRAFLVIGAGRVICIHCGHENVLNRFATCNRCRATEYGSLLFCSFCRQVSRYLTCDGCSVTLRILPEASK